MPKTPPEPASKQELVASKSPGVTAPAESATLGVGKSDVAAAAVRAVTSFIPVGGGLISELITNFIPNQRADRIEHYAGLVAAGLDEVEQAILREKITDPEAIDLFEEGARQSTRALSEERREQIARLVAFGMTGEERERVEAKRLLALMGELDNAQIIILSSYLRRNRDDKTFQRTHETLLRVRPPTINDNDPKKRDTYAVHNLGQDQLLRLGLVHQRFNVPKKGEVPQFDQDTGTLKAGPRDLTHLGRLLLTRIGLADPGEF